MMRWLKVIGDSIKHNWLAKAGAALIFFPLLILLAIYVRFWSMNWGPVRAPISLRPGGIRQSFMINSTARYFIDIELQTGALSQQSIRCLTGVPGFHGDPACPEQRILNFNWRLIRGGEIVSFGTYDGGGGTSVSTDDADVGYFDGKRGEKYDLVLNVISDASKLDVAQPTLSVSINPVNVESALVMEGLSRVVVVVLGVAGMILLALGVRYHRMFSN
jgi:hypothetical protein